MRRSPPPRIGPLAILLACAAALLTPASALAGRLVETGHAVDRNCAVDFKQCHFVKAALSYVRAGAPDPSKPVLVLDTVNVIGDPGAFEMQDAITRAFSPAIVSTTVVSPRTPGFATIPINTATWSAIAVASDWTCGGCDLNHTAAPCGVAIPPCLADTTAIESRLQDIVAFFNAGGGLLVGAGADAGDAHPGDNYYDFVDSPGADPVAPTTTFVLTTAGRRLGFTDGSLGSADDINAEGPGSASNTFSFPPVGSRLQVAETGAAGGNLITLFEDTDAPSTVITSGPSGTVPSQSASFVFHATENLVSQECRLDSAVFAPCTSPASFGGLVGGRHVFNVRAVDLAGNVQETPTTREWTIAFGRVNATISSFFQVNGGATRIKTLTAHQVPSGATLRLTCKGRGCAFKKRTHQRRHPTVKLVSDFRHRALRPGAVIELRISKPGSIAKVARFTTKRGALPRTQILCLAPGATRPTATCSEFPGV